MRVNKRPRCPRRVRNGPANREPPSANTSESTSHKVCLTGEKSVTPGYVEKKRIFAFDMNGGRKTLRPDDEALQLPTIGQWIIVYSMQSRYKRLGFREGLPSAKPKRFSRRIEMDQP